MAKKITKEAVFNYLFKAVENNKNKLAFNLSKSKRKRVEDFQNKVCEELNEKEKNKENKDYTWITEYKLEDREEKDRIDIYGKPIDDNQDAYTWIIEIDATRADQIGKKMISRFALFKEKKIMYVVIAYPGTKSMQVPECDKYIQYGYDVLKTMNKQNDLKAIYVKQLNEKDGSEKIEPNCVAKFSLQTNTYPSMSQVIKAATEEWLRKNNNDFYELIRRATKSTSLKPKRTPNHNRLQKVFSKNPLKKNPIEILCNDSIVGYVTSQWILNGDNENFTLIKDFFSEEGIIIS